MMKLISEQPAKLFGMYPQKGALSVGSDADIVIYDPNAEGMITAAGQYQNVDYTPYEGIKTYGRIETVLLSGEIAVQDGGVRKQRQGRYVHRRRSIY